MDITNRTWMSIRHHAFDESTRHVQQAYRSICQLNNVLWISIAHIYGNVKQCVSSTSYLVRDRFTSVMTSTTDNAKEYCDVGLKKMHSLIDEVKREREKFLGHRDTLKPEQEQELQTVCTDDEHVRVYCDVLRVS
jgi:hypothetical protein